jgi:RNA polymerase sigma-70 factor (ECF subfamily)
MQEPAVIDEQREQEVRELTTAMAEGSEAAYDRFYQIYFDRLYRHVLVLTRGDEPLAREILQQLLLRVVRYVKATENERMLWAWLKQIARSCHVDWLRRHAKDSAAISLENIHEQQIESAPAAEEEPLFEALEICLGQLEAPERELLHVIYFDHWPRQKIAEAWNISIKAIESRLGRVRQKLRKLILQKLKDHAPDR